MPVEVEAPDGSVIEFPDGTSPQTMRDAMRRRYGGSPGYNRARSQQQRRVEAPRIPVVSDFNQFVDQIPRNLGVADELAALGSGATQGITNLARRATGRPVETTMQEAGQAAADFQIAERERYRRANPAADVGATIAGIPIALGRAPAAAATGFLSRAAAGRGLPAWMAQTAQGAGTGMLFGAGFGALNADGGFEERGEGAQRGGEMGALLGSLAPTAINAARPVLQAGAGLFGRLQVDPSRVGSLGGNVTMRPLTPPVIPPQAAGTIDRMADRAGLSAADVEARLAAARANPQGRVLADIFDVPGVQTMRPIAQSPGRSGQRATTVARERIAGAQGRIMQRLNGGLGVGETRRAAITRLEGEYRDLSANAYAPLWANALTPEQVALYEQRIAPLLAPDNPNPELRRIMQRAIREAQRQFNLDRATGRVVGDLTDNTARYLHYIKMGLGDVAQFEKSPLRGTSGMRIASLRQLYRQFGDLLDPGNAPAIIPNYRAVTEQAGDYFSAREALEVGEAWLRMSPEEVTAQIQTMTPFERYHARVALADEVRDATRGRVVGNRNVANALDDPSMQGAIAAAFENPAQAAEFLDTLNTQNQLARNALEWGGGSQSWANAMYGADEAAHALTDAVGNVATGNPGQAVSNGVRGALRSITSRRVEQANNVRGEALLTRVDEGPGAEAFARAVVDELRKREAARAAGAAGARAGGAGAGGQNGRRRN